MFEEIFLRKKMIPQKLLQYGFQCVGDSYHFTTEIFDGSFRLVLIFYEQGQIDTSLTEIDTGEEYILYKTSAQGTFVGDVRTAISEILEDIADKCFETSIFRQEQTLQLVEYVSKRYGDELEFLWEKFSDNGIWRRKDTQKWYGVVLKISKRKLGIASDDIVEVLNLRIVPEELEALLGRKEFYPGWHMNKRHWFTVILDGSVSTAELQKLIQASYALATK